MLVVPFTPDYDQRFTSQLGDDRFVFDARWNERGQVWTVDITRDSDQELLIAGIPILAGQDILSPYALGIGGLVPMDLSLKDTDPGPDDFGERVIVAWFSNDELAAIDAALRAAGRPSIISPGVPPSLIRGDISRPVSPVSGGGSGGITQIINVTTNTTSISVTGGGNGFSDKFEALDDSTGTEVLIGRYLNLAGLNPNDPLTLAAAVMARGNGTIRIYAGGSMEAFGSTGTPSGSLIDSVAVTADGMYQLTGTVANPGGIMPIKITMESAAPATNIGVDIINGFVT
jgi:hypothetical protein